MTTILTLCAAFVLLTVGMILGAVEILTREARRVLRDSASHTSPVDLGF